MNQGIRSLQIIASPGMGGAETSFLRHSLALERDGHAVSCGIRRDAALQNFLAPTGLPCVTFPMRNYFDVDSALRIRRWIKTESPQIVQTWASRASWLTRAPDGVAHIARLGGQYRPRYFRHAQAWIVNTDGMRSWLIENGFPQDRVARIPNFVPADSAQLGNAISRKTLGIAADALLIVALGRFLEKKGFQDLIAAFQSLPECLAQRPIHLMLLGDGPMMGALSRQAMATQTRIHFTGWVDYPLATLSVADVFVCPSRIEPMGNVLLEAWSRGLPVLSTQTAGGRELIKDGETGLLCPVADPESMRKHLVRLLLEPQLRQDLGQRGLRHLNARYSEQKTLRALVDFYQRMLRHQSVRSAAALSG